MRYVFLSLLLYFEFFFQIILLSDIFRLLHVTTSDNNSIRFLFDNIANFLIYYLKIGFWSTRDLEPVALTRIIYYTMGQYIKISISRFESWLFVKRTSSILFSLDVSFTVINRSINLTAVMCIYYSIIINSIFFSIENKRIRVLIKEKEKIERNRVIFRLAVTKEYIVVPKIY